MAYRVWGVITPTTVAGGGGGGLSSNLVVVWLGIAAGVIGILAAVVPFVRWLQRRQKAADTERFDAPPRRLPRDPDLFVGGSAERALRELSAACLAPGMVAVVGDPGVGKSTLCARYVNSSVGVFHERRWWADLAGVATRDEVEARIAAAIGVASFADAVQRLGDREARSLLVLDNSETAWTESPQRFEPVLDALQPTVAARTTIVVAARGRDLLNRDYPWRIVEPALLTPSDGRALFLRYAPRHEHDPVLGSLLERCGGLPLAVELVARAVVDEPSMARLSEHLPIAELSTGAGDTRTTSLAYSLELSLGSPRVTPPTRRVLDTIALFPDGLAPEDLDAICAEVSLPHRAARSLLEVGLLRIAGAGLRCLQPIREYVLAVYPLAGPQRVELLQRFARRAADQTDANDTLWRATNIANVDFALSELLGAAGPDPDGLRLATALLAATDHRLPSPRLLALAEATPELAEPLARRLTQLSEDPTVGNSTKVAALNHLRNHHHHIGDQHGEASALHGLGDIASAQGDYEVAAGHYNNALTIFRRIGNQHGEASALRGLGDIARAQGDYGVAAGHYNNAYTIAKRIGSVRTQALAAEQLARLVGDDQRPRLAAEAINAWKAMGQPRYAHQLEAEFRVVTTADASAALPVDTSPIEPTGR